MNTVYLENVLDSFKWAGRPMDEISRETAEGNLDFKGKLFGGEINYGTASTTKDSKIDEISIIVSEHALKREKALEELIRLYGLPFESGEEPYALANGGVVFWYRFYDGKGMIVFSYGEENQFSQIKYRLSVTPVSEKEDNRLTIDNFADMTGYDVDFEKLHEGKVSVFKTQWHNYTQFVIMINHDDMAEAISLFQGCDDYPDEFYPGQSDGYDDFSEGDVKMFVSNGKDQEDSAVFWKEDDDIWMISFSEKKKADELKAAKEKVTSICRKR